MKLNKWLCMGMAVVSLQAFAQDELISKLKDNQSEQANFVFEDVVDAEATSVKNQGSSGTCWSYSANSFLESEMMRMGKEPVDLADMFTVRNQYIEKAEMYVRMHGGLNYGQGGALHDVTDMYKKYGALPQGMYTGLNYGTDINRFGEMEAILKGMLDAVIKNKNRELSPVWKEAFTKVVDTYLGEVPESFVYNGKTYTPKSFAKEVVGIHADDYIEFTSWKSEPMYEKVVLKVPDNWSYAMAYNVPMEDMTKIADNALKNGFTIAWATDVSEKGFSWKNGVAYVPVKEYKDMSDQERKQIFNGPKPDRKITPEMRQYDFDSYETTDDHGMQITGISKDQSGKKYYKVKNSWGVSNDFGGYLYVSKPFFTYKTTSFMVHKDAIPKDIRKKLGIK